MKQYASDFMEKETMAVFLAREFDDKDWVVAGAFPEICFGAAMLAQKTHAPSLIVQAGGSCFYCNVSGRDCTLYPSSTEYRNIEWAEARFPHYDTSLVTRKRTKMVVGALEVDRYGNCNLFGIGFDGKKWKFRGPGMVGIESALSLIKENYIVITRHDRRTLVEKVEYVSGVGFGNGPGSREGLGLVGKGPKYIITPKAVFDFEEKTKRARLFKLMPSVRLDWVLQNTGFDIVMPQRVDEVEPPTVDEIKVLRSIDKLGLLRKQ